MEYEDKSDREVECKHEIEREGMKTPPEMIDDNSNADTRLPHL